MTADEVYELIDELEDIVSRDGTLPEHRMFDIELRGKVNPIAEAILTLEKYDENLDIEGNRDNSTYYTTILGEVDKSIAGGITRDEIIRLYEIGVTVDSEINCWVI